MKITITNFLSDSLAAQHQHPALDPAALHPVQTKPPQNCKAVPLPKLTRAVFQPFKKPSYSLWLNILLWQWIPRLDDTLHRADCKVFGELCIQCAWNCFAEIALWAALTRLWCGIISPCTSSKTNRYAQEWDENADLTIRGLSSRCCSALAFLQDCRQAYTFCFYIWKAGLKVLPLPRLFLFLRAVSAQQNPNPHWKVWVHQ